jgi:hypothetical protein
MAVSVLKAAKQNAQAAKTHLTTEAQIEAAVARGDAIEVDLGFAFNCSVVPAQLYWKGSPVS